jgi:YD repeat-containing protein
LLTDTNQLGKTRTRGYDNVGNLVRSIDRDGRAIAYSYDTLNRATTERWIGTNGQAIETIATSYDAVGRVTTTGDINSRYTYGYDAIDRVTTVDNAGTPSVPRVLLNYGYDAVGNLVSTTDTIGTQLTGTLNYTYDQLNRLTSCTNT